MNEKANSFLLIVLLSLLVKLQIIINIYIRGDINGIGKWYMGREIARVMGFQGIGWLERSSKKKKKMSLL